MPVFRGEWREINRDHDRVSHSTQCALRDTGLWSGTALQFIPDRSASITEGGFSNPPIRRGEACLAQIPVCHAGKRVRHYVEKAGWKTRPPLNSGIENSIRAHARVMPVVDSSEVFDHDQDHDDLLRAPSCPRWIHIPFSHFPFSLQPFPSSSLHPRRN